MKKYTKIILLALIMLCLIPSKNVEAKASFMDGDYIPNVYFKKEKNGQGKYRQARFLVRASDKKFAYCIEPWLEMDSNVTYQEEINANTLSDETLKKISLIAYYGYGYKKHTSSEWYYITQILIWRTADPEGDFYFTDTLNGNRTTKYDPQIREIEQLVTTHNKLPQLPSKKTIMLGEKVSLVDQNYVLNQFSMSKSENITFEKSNQFLDITAVKPGKSTITFTKKDKTYSVNPIIYHSNTNQDFLTVGSFSPLIASIEIEVVSGEIKILKKDLLTGTSSPSGNASLLGSIFELYDENKNKIATITLEDTLEKSFQNLKKGTYYVKEVKPGEGYLLNEEEKQITLNENHPIEEVTFFNKVIENKIIIKKYYGKEEGILKEEENASFEVYNEENVLLTTLTTDENGVIETTLPYGTYRLHQIKTKENYKEIEDFIVIVKEENEIQTFEKYDYEKTGKLIIVKLDKETKNPIKKNPATFLITNKETKETWQKQTDEFGILSLDHLSLGNYEIKEIIAPTGYQINATTITIHLEEEKKILELENEKEKIIVEVPDTSTFQVKVETYYLNDKKKYYSDHTNRSTM